MFLRVKSSKITALAVRYGKRIERGGLGPEFIACMQYACHMHACTSSSIKLWEENVPCCECQVKVANDLICCRSRIHQI
jgi:hypothetical protein